MSLFAVIRQAGPAWTDGQGIAEQPAVGEHAAFMNALAEEEFVLFGGPLAGSEHGRVRVLLIVNAETETGSTDASPTTPGYPQNNSAQ